MYGWGPADTGTWKDPKGYSYDSTKRAYLDKLATDASARGPRTYSRRGAPDSKLVTAKGKDIATDSENPIILAVDVTGSMSSWPAEIFDRLPLLYQTLGQYRSDLEMSFAAIGDATCDNYPLQVGGFEKGVALEDQIKALCPEGGGGGQVSESYELFGHYLLNHCKTPKATSPFLFIFGDEKFYEHVNPDQVEHYIGDRLEGPVSSADVWAGLLQRFNMYFLHKPYGVSGDSGIDKVVVGQWSDAIGPQRVIELPSKERAVDVALGIVAKHWGKYDDFDKNLSARHTDPGVKASVHKSIRHVPSAAATASVLKGSRKAASTRSLSAITDPAGSP